MYLFDVFSHFVQFFKNQKNVGFHYYSVRWMNIKNTPIMWCAEFANKMVLRNQLFQYDSGMF